MLRPAVGVLLAAPSPSFAARRRHRRLWLEVLGDESPPAGLHPSGQRAAGWAHKEAAGAVTFASCAEGSGRQNASPARLLCLQTRCLPLLLRPLGGAESLRWP